MEPATGTHGGGTANTGTHGDPHLSTGGTSEATTTMGAGETSGADPSVGTTSVDDSSTASTSTGEMPPSTSASSEGEESSSASSGTNDSSETTSDTGTSECMPGESRCLSPTQQQDCGPLGLWETPQSCVDQTCVDDRCRGECAPEQQRCLGDAAQGCDERGQWLIEDRCDAPGQYCEDGVCQLCRPWTQQFGSDKDDEATSVAIDASGELYVVGNINGAFNTPQDAFLVKYSPEGARRWRRQFGTEKSDEASGIAVDASDNLYVLGKTYGALPGRERTMTEESGDLFVMKYNTEGKLQRTKQFGSNADDWSGSIAVDRFGQLHISGRSFGLFPGLEESDKIGLLVTKYDSEFALQWTQSIGVSRASLTSTPQAAVGDHSGQIYVAGFLVKEALPDSQGKGDAFLIKYSSKGQRAWTRRFGSGSLDYATGLVIDNNSQAVYVIGSTSGQFPGNTSEGASDAFVAKYDAEGNLQWTRQFGTPEADFARRIAIDPSGEVYVAGMTSGILPNGGGSKGKQDAFVAKYDSNGERLEIRQFGSSEDDEVGGIVVDASGRNVYVVGTTEGSLPGGGGSIGNDDAFIQHLCFTKH